MGLNIKTCVCGAELKNYGHLYRCKQWRAHIAKLTEECLQAHETNIRKMYCDEGMSLHAVADAVNFPGGFSRLHRWLKANGLNRTISEARLTTFSKERYKSTMIERYGHAHNFSKDHPSRKEWEKRLVEEEGIVNVFQRGSVKKKSAQTVLQKYGVPSANLLPRKGRSNYSYIHRFVYTQLRKLFPRLNIQLEHVVMRDETTYYAYDIFIEEWKCIFEVNGDYWHANPNIYFKDDLIQYGTKKFIPASEVWQKDAAKLDKARSLGYDVIMIWESDLYSSDAAFKTCLENLRGKHNEDFANQIDQAYFESCSLRFDRRNKPQFLC